MLAALTTLTRYAQMSANIRHSSLTVTAYVTNLLIGDLSTNAYVH